MRPTFLISMMMLLIGSAGAEYRVAQSGWFVALRDTVLSGKAVHELNKTIPYLKFVAVPTWIPEGFKESSAGVKVSPGMGGGKQVAYELVFSNAEGATIEIAGILGKGWGGLGLVNTSEVDTLIFGKIQIGHRRESTSGDLETDPLFFENAGKDQKNGVFGVLITCSSEVSGDQAKRLLKSMRLLR